MLLVTSSDLTGFQQYGQKLLQTLNEWSTLPVRVYSEDELTTQSWPLQQVDGWQSFQDDTAHIKPTSYLYDARRFAHKVYAQLDAFNSDHRYVVWLDADVVVTAELTEDFLKGLLDGGFCAFLGRDLTYTETGFLIFDILHDDFPEFHRRYRDLYDNRRLFSLPYWIDCLAFDTSRQGLNATNLTPEAAGMIDVFSRSPLKDVMHHNKGQRKFQ